MPISNLLTTIQNEMKKTDKIKVDNQKMKELADELTTKIPGLGFALIVIDFENEKKTGNYISNVNKGYMVRALENQIIALKKAISDTDD